MSTLVSQNPAVNTKPGKDNGEPTTPAFALTMGPTAIASKAVYQMLDMYAEIIAWAQKEKQEMVQAQSSEAQGQADAMKKAGEELMNYQIASAVLGGTGTLVGGGAMLGMTTFGEAGRAGNEASEMNEKLTPMRKVDSYLKNPDITASTEKEGSNVQGELFAETDMRVSDRVRQFRDFGFSRAEEKKPTFMDRALGRGKAMEARNKENDEITLKAARDLKNDAKWKERFHDEMDTQLKDINSVLQRQNTATTTASTLNSLVGGVGNSVSGAVSGVGQAEKAKEDAKSTLYSAAAQMAGATGSEFAQEASKADQSQKSAVDTLLTLNRSNGAEG